MKTKSTSQTPRTFTRNAILLAVAGLVLCASPAVALAQCPNKLSTVWTYHGTGDWFTSSNWSNGVPICTNEVSYDAKINNGYTAQINTGSASACEVSLGVNPTDSGNLSVNGSGSNLTTCSGTLVGYQGKGNLSITNGGVVTTDIDASIAWGTTSNTSSNGSATVDGTNSTWAVHSELDIGGTTNAPGGTGLLTVTNGGTVTAASLHVWKSGTLTGNSTVSTTNGTAVDGTLAPSGTLTISGDLSFGPFANMRCNVTSTSWDRAEVSGTATLDGKLSVTLTGFFTGDFPLLHAAGGIMPNTTFSSVSFTYSGCLAPSIRYDYVNGYVYLHVESTCQ
jgi:T5SS/PEP-CTERM-associated repeat protein